MWDEEQEIRPDPFSFSSSPSPGIQNEPAVTGRPAPGGPWQGGCSDSRTFHSGVEGGSVPLSEDPRQGSGR